MGIGFNHGPMTDPRHAQQAAINELTSLVLAERAPMSNLGGCGNSALQTVVTHSNPQKDSIWLVNFIKRLRGCTLFSASYFIFLKAAQNKIQV